MKVDGKPLTPGVIKLVSTHRIHFFSPYTKNKQFSFLIHLTQNGFVSKTNICRQWDKVILILMRVKHKWS